MNKNLLFYWYVRDDGWHDLYDFHLRNLEAYKDVFTKAIFIISHDDDTPQEYINTIVCKLNKIYPDAEIIYWKNDKVTRESKYVHDEIALKFQYMPDEWYFWGHCKGIDSNYVTKDYCYKWVAGMYFMNLYDIASIEKSMSLPDTCVIGTYLRTQCNAMYGSRYNWHYSGTFWWFNPKRIYRIMKQYDNHIPPVDRYISEALFGFIIPNEDRYRKPAMNLYNMDPKVMPIELKNKLFEKIKPVGDWKELLNW